MVETDITYRIKVGNLYVKNVARKGVELTAYKKDAWYVSWDFEDKYGHEEHVADKLKQLAEYGITDAKIVKHTIVTEYSEKEVVLNMVGTKLKLTEPFISVEIDTSTGQSTVEYHE